MFIIITRFPSSKWDVCGSSSRSRLCVIAVKFWCILSFVSFSLIHPAFSHLRTHHLTQVQEHSSRAHLAHCNLVNYSSVVQDDSKLLFSMPSVGGSAPPQPTPPNGIYNVLMTGNTMTTTGGIPTASSSANLNGTSNSGEEISTIFVVGFPDDMQEREFQNMFIFSPGFEAATLKIPTKDQEEDIHSNGNGTSSNNNRKQIVSIV